MATDEKPTKPKASVWVMKSYWNTTCGSSVIASLNEGPVFSVPMYSQETLEKAIESAVQEALKTLNHPSTPQ